ncbi:hypothetical protein HMPREF0970_01878 [Schaalia odontolytica F0309]|uniref:Transposase IS204/IS1001/IS1096/IS1165 DDE domain-containing protein n=1 Tax=Schaalia odontolytica F0309 TaxID=649742 RepID=D4U0Y4_9ACTO|nr:hypothetical protein HMPREF0970_01878 [Schaalia odontolytica F0309]
MDEFIGFKYVGAEDLPSARAGMDPFHVVHSAGIAVEKYRRRTGKNHFRRGRAKDPL